jgi:hypothetical protein
MQPVFSLNQVAGETESQFVAQGKTAARPLAELLKFIQRNAQLSQDLIEQGRPNFLAAVDRYGRHPSIRVIPSRVTAFLSFELES